MNFLTSLSLSVSLFLSLLLSVSLFGRVVLVSELACLVVERSQSNEIKRRSLVWTDRQTEERIQAIQNNHTQNTHKSSLPQTGTSHVAS